MGNGRHLGMTDNMEWQSIRNDRHWGNGRQLGLTDNGEWQTIRNDIMVNGRQ